MKRLLLSMAVLFASLTGFSQTDPGAAVEVQNNTACTYVVRLVALDGCTLQTGGTAYIIVPGITMLPAPPPGVHYEGAILFGLVNPLAPPVYYVDIQTPSVGANWPGVPCAPPTIPTMAGFVSCAGPSMVGWVGTSANPVIEIN